MVIPKFNFHFCKSTSHTVGVVQYKLRREKYEKIVMETHSVKSASVDWTLEIKAEGLDSRTRDVCS